MSAARDDLLRLGDAQLAALANVGLLKRARREVEAGRGPTLELNDEGTLVATSPDGAVSHIGKDPSAVLGTCTCGAPRACRHRIAAVLQLQKEQGDEDAGEAWSPGAFSDEALADLVGARTMSAARQALSHAVPVRVHPGATPSAELPNATVSFWAPDALHLARCDCGKSACVHLVLAVWAFRAHPEEGLVVLGEAEAAEPAGALARVEPALTELLRVGLASLDDLALLAETRAALEEADHAWLRDAFEDIERQKERYDRKSTVFRTEAVVRCVAELVARTRAASAPAPALPRGMLLGSEKAAAGGRTDRMRLIGIGAETEADGARRLATAYFVEPISMTVLALRHEWEREGKEPPNGAALGRLYASSRRSLAELAGGYVVARGARRRANGLLDLSRARAIQPSNAPGEVWGEIEAPVRVESLDMLSAQRAKDPPPMLAPRLVGHDVHVLSIDALVDIGYSAAHQEVVAIVADDEGGECFVRSFHRDVSPGRVDAIYRALSEGARQIAGRLTRTPRGWEMLPLAVAAAHGRVVVPDIEATRPYDKEPRPALFGESGSRSLFAELDALVARGVHRGYASVRSELSELARRFETAGATRTAALLEQAQRGGASSFLDVVMASQLVHEAS